VSAADRSGPPPGARGPRDRLRAAALRAAAAVRPRLAPVEVPLRDALLSEIRVRVADALAPRADGLTEARAAADALADALRAAEPRAAAALARLDRSPFLPSTTVHAAHARHPGVQAIFARRGLPRCPDCAVGADETLAEAAWGESFPLDALLAELNELLGPTKE
jgi:hypothetical protein